MIWISDTNNDGIWFNNAWLDYTGLPMEQQLGTAWATCVHPDDLTSAIEACNAAFAARAKFQMEFRLRRADGSYGWILDTGIPRYNSDGEFIGYLGYCWDISKTMEAEQQLQALEEENRFLLEWSRRLQNVTSYDDALAATSDAMQKQVGYSYALMYILANEEDDYVKLISASGTIADNISSSYPTLQISGDPFMVDVINSDVPLVVDNMYEDPRTDKAIVKALDIWTVINIPIRLAGKNFGTLCTGTIGNEGVRPPDERQLRIMQKMAAHLAPVIERIQFIEKLNQAQNQLEQANNAKTEFLSRMSHELRTPLNAVLGYAQLLEMDEMMGDNHQSSIQEILQAGEHLLQLVNEVLELSQIDSGQITINRETVSLITLVNNCIMLHDNLAARNSVVIDNRITDSRINCLADPFRLKQVLLNLISNAIKYNRNSGTVTLTCESVADGRVKVSVIDTGIGLEPEQLEKLFQPFERAGAENSGVDGYGIGLSITRRLLELMDGAIEVKSAPGRGSTFSFTLPVA